MVDLNIIEAPKKRRAIGIDLGTTHSLVALDNQGQIDVLKDGEGQVLLPSCVRYCEDGRCIVGSLAKLSYHEDPKNTLISVKRLIGRTPYEAMQFIPLPYEFVDVHARVAEIKTRHGNKNPVVVCAEILKQLLARARQVDGTIQDAVITVPAYFDDAQRQATKDAAQVAGIQVLRLINEPTAAAIAYGLDKGAKGHCFVYDLGGGTFDVSVLQLSNGVFEILATGGDTALGGDDIDYLIANWLCSQVPTLNLPKAMSLARHAKETLSSQDSVLIDLPDNPIALTKKVFNEIIEPVIAKTIQHCMQVLKDAKLKIEQIDEIVLVGGSTRIPLVRERLTQFFSKAPLADINPDTVVAVGAAIQASLISGNRTSNELLLLDVIPLSLGIEMMGGVVDKVLMRNTPIPAIATQTFTTFKDNQTGLILHIVQGERESAKDCRSLATLELSFPPMPAGKARIEVTFRVDADGLLSVDAQELLTGVRSHIEVKPTYGLTRDEVMSMVKSSIENAEADIKQRKIEENRQQIEHLNQLNQKLQNLVQGKHLNQLDELYDEIKD